MRRRARSWTKEQLSDLRDTIQKDLRAAIDPPIVAACKKAILAGKQLKPGAKERILRTFDEGGMEAVEKARKAAEVLLTANYNAIVAGLEEGFLKEHHDPVRAAFDALTDQTAGRARRSDAQKRSRVLREVHELMEEVTVLLGSAPAEVAV